MTLLRRWVSYVRRLLDRETSERQMHDELQTFVEMSTAAKMREGVPAAEARRQAMIELGGFEQIKESVRTYRHGARLDEIGRDVRYAFRMFGKQPGFTGVVLLTLALGIGANTAIFGLIDALMLRWLPVRDPRELVLVKFTPAGSSTPSESFSHAIVRALSDRREIFAGVAGFSSMVFNAGAPGAVVRVPAALVTGGFYETLGLNPAIGRLLAAGDDERGAAPVAVISHGYWERQFARNPAAVGQALLVNGVAVTIVGVGPRGFSGANVGSIADITMSVAALPRISPEAAPLLGSGNFWLRVLARPRSGVTHAQALARLDAVWPGISEPVIAPHWPPGRRKSFREATFQFSPGGTGWSYLRQIYAKPLVILMGMVAVVLLVACANVASLLLARTSARQREISVRLAIGAGRARIVRQLLIESTLLSSMGAALGIALAWFSGRFLVALISTGPAQVFFDLTPNWHVLGFTSAVAIATGVLFGIAPALQATGANPAVGLTEDTRVGTARSRLLPSLVSAQVALSLVLLVGAGLFVRTLRNLQSFDPGFRSEGVLLVQMESRRTAVPREVLDEIERVTGVVSASVSTHTPLSGSIWSEPAVPRGQALPERDTAFFVGAGPRFFATMQIPVLSGREFTDHDSASAPAVALINERFAERYFGGKNAVGRLLSAKVRGESRELEIIGLVRNTNAAGLRQAPPPTVYVCYAQLTGDFPTTLEVRAAGALGRVAAGVQESLRRTLAGAAVEVRPLSAQVEATMVQERMMAALAGAFGLLALTVACVGLYGLLAYGVARRAKEFAIRLALGAQPRQVIAQVVGTAARLVLLGIAIGLPAAWGVSRWVESLLFGLDPVDPVAVGGAILLVAATAQVAAYLPALRAARVDPLAALRRE